MKGVILILLKSNIPPPERWYIEIQYSQYRPSGGVVMFNTGPGGPVLANTGPAGPVLNITTPPLKLNVSMKYRPFYIIM